MYGGYLSCIVGACFILGQISGGIFCKAIGKVKYQIMFTLGTGGILLACEWFDSFPCGCFCPANKIT